MKRRGRRLLVVALALSLAGCGSWEVDWQKTGQLWIGALCDGVSKCSYDADGDPYTLH